MDLALSLMTVVWWATQIAQPAFVGGIYLMLLIIMNVATPSQVFSSAWTGSIMWLVIGAYLIAGAVNESGLGQRIAYAFIIKFVRSWKGIVISIFALTFILALLISPSMASGVHDYVRHYGGRGNGEDAQTRFG